MKYKNTRPIAILMGVYNGSKYLSEQINSLLNQKNKDWTLYIRDDGSTDDSKEIILKYCENYNNIVLFDDGKGNFGSEKNFFEILNNVNSDYYMFCDQDDIWLEDKIEVTYSKLKSLENKNNSIVVFTDLKIVDNDLNVISNSFWSYSKINPDLLLDPSYWGVSNLMTGCTMMFNKEMKSSVGNLPSDIKVMHDSWISLSATAFNSSIGVIKEPTILYRQHDNNVIGAIDTSNNYILRKMASLISVYNENINQLKILKIIKEKSFFNFWVYKLLYILKR